MIVTAEVRNTGARDGDEVAELYIKPPQTAVSPRVELEGFTENPFRAGETQRVQFTLSPRQLSEVDEKGNRAVMSGDYADLHFRRAAGSGDACGDFAHFGDSSAAEVIADGGASGPRLCALSAPELESARQRSREQT